MDKIRKKIFFMYDQKNLTTKLPASMSLMAPLVRWSESTPAVHVLLVNEFLSIFSIELPSMLIVLRFASD